MNAKQLTQDAVVFGKFLMALGGFSCFMSTFTIGLYVGNEYSVVLAYSAFACIVGALLMRGFLHVFYGSLFEVLAKKHKENASNDDKPNVNERNNAAQRGT